MNIDLESVRYSRARPARLREAFDAFFAEHAKLFDDSNRCIVNDVGYKNALHAAFVAGMNSAWLNGIGLFGGVAARNPGICPETYDWRYLCRAWCHFDQGYYLNMFERMTLVYVPETEKSFAVSDRPIKVLCWGEILKYEVKQVSELTGKEEYIPHRTWHLVTPNTQYILGEKS